MWTPKAPWHGDNAKAVIVGRVMNFPLVRPQEPELWILPKGMTRSGGVVPRAMEWTSQYASLVIPLTWIADGAKVGAATDGVNQAGLAGHTLFLEEGRCREPDGKKPVMSNALWLQYLLDKCKSVQEAVDLMKLKKFDLHSVTVKKPLPAHITLEDRTGDSVVIECNMSGLHFHRGSRYPVVTNSLTCKTQSTELAKFKPFGGTKAFPFPGTNHSIHRFVRAKYFLKHLEAPKTNREMVAYLMSVLRNVSSPFIKAEKKIHPYPKPTWWRAIADLTSNVYYVESTRSPNVSWVTLDELDLGERDLPAVLSFRHDSVGELSRDFTCRTKPFALPPTVTI
jgi:choloylglycine hydrolase